MMLSCIIHFGMHKTGSSSIQASLWRHLKDERFHYVDLGDPNTSGKLQTAFMRDPRLTPAHRRKSAGVDEIIKHKDRIIANLSSELKSAKGKIAILSGEGIIHLSEQELQDLINALGIDRGEINIVGYVRSPKSYMESAFQERVKAGLDMLNFPNLYPAYRKRFEKLDAVFGTQNVFFWPFDTGSFSAGCVVQDFCRRLDIAFSPADVIKINDGLPLPAVSLLYAYMKLGPGYGRGRSAIREIKLMINCVTKLRGSKLRFHSDLVAPIIQANLDDIGWMEARLGCSLTEDLTADDDYAVRSEEDLLTFAPETLQWLADQLGPDYANRWHPDMPPKEVAQWMHVLRLGLVTEQKATRKKAGKLSFSTPGDDEMNIKKLVQRAKQAAPESLGSIHDANGVALVGEVFRQIVEEIGTLDEGAVSIGGLGKFRVMKVEREIDGRKISDRRIRFVATTIRESSVAGEE